MGRKAVIIGGGFGGLAAACLLGKAGYDVVVYEKNDQLGGRIGRLKAEGFTFDTGPSWYLMPDVFEHFFAQMDEKLSDHVQLTKLSPSYRVFYKDLGARLDITGDIEQDARTFDAVEPGAGKHLQRYLERSSLIYETAIDKFLYKNYASAWDFVTPETLRASRQLSIFTNLDRYVRRYFKDPRLQKIMEYPSVFLGASPYNTPALYSLMSHVDFKQGVFYPRGGMYTLVEALVNIGKKHGVRYHVNAAVEQIITEDHKARGIVVHGEEIHSDLVVSDAGVQFTESQLLGPEERDHSERYWQKRTLAPSALLMYLGVDRQYDSLLHHNLLFSNDWRRHFAQIFDRPQFPTDPSLYICAPGKTDPSVAPKGKENLFVLVPLAPGLTYTDQELERYADKILATIEHAMDLPGLRKNLMYKKLLCVRDFAEKFNSPSGTGLGLSHTLFQTAAFRPKNYSKKVTNLYYVGADVHPGIGLPTTLISAELLAYRLLSGNK